MGTHSGKMVVLAAPKAVSPLIKFTRWTALIAGIGYGSMRFNSLAKQEVVIQAEYDIKRKEIAERVAREKAAASEAEMKNLAIEAGVVPKLLYLSMLDIEIMRIAVIVEKNVWNLQNGSFLFMLK